MRLATSNIEGLNRIYNLISFDSRKTAAQVCRTWEINVLPSRSSSQHSPGNGNRTSSSGSGPSDIAKEQCN